MAKGFKTGGRQKGTPNKINALLKDEILQAADEAHPEGRVGYLRSQATENPVAFMTLLGKVMPTQIVGDADAPLIHKIELVAVKPSVSTD
jgi:stalled ribosome alternative rescue factor ArfA